MCNLLRFGVNFDEIVLNKDIQTRKWSTLTDANFEIDVSTVRLNLV